MNDVNLYEQFGINPLTSEQRDAAYQAARAALDEWLKLYLLRCYQTDDLWLSINRFIVCYITGNDAYHAIAFIHVD